MNRILGLVLLLLTSFGAQATNHYVNNVTGNSSYDGSSPVHTTGNIGPWPGPRCSASNIHAGDTEFMAYTGVPYTDTASGNIFCTSNSGTANAPIIFDGGDPSTGMPPYASIQVAAGHAVQVQGNASYIIFQHFYTVATGTNESDFFVGSSGFAGTVHHISIRYNIMAFASGACVQIEFADYVTTHDNSIENCGSTSNPQSVSNISYLAPTVVAGDDGQLDGCYDLPGDMVVTYGTNYRNCIVRNYLYYGFKGLGVVSDGNNIILDDWRCSQFLVTNCLGVNYGYAALVAENVTFSADGRNIHVFAVSTTVGVTRVTHNTGYNACQTGAAGPCNSVSGAFTALGKTGYPVGGIRFDHNFIYSPLALTAHPISISVATGGSFQVDCDDLFGGSTPVYSDGTATAVVQSNNITTNPNLANPSTTPASAAFQPTNLTPAFPAGC